MKQETALTQHINFLLGIKAEIRKRALKYSIKSEDFNTLSLADIELSKLVNHAISLLDTEREKMEDMFNESESYSEHEESPDAKQYFDTHYTQYKAEDKNATT